MLEQMQPEQIIYTLLEAARGMATQRFASAVKKLNIHLVNDPAIPLLGKDLHLFSHKNHTLLFVVDLFTVIVIWKQHLVPQLVNV